jgi:hypothetical protein
MTADEARQRLLSLIADAVAHGTLCDFGCCGRALDLANAFLELDARMRKGVLQEEGGGWPSAWLCPNDIGECGEWDDRKEDGEA